MKHHGSLDLKFYILLLAAVPVARPATPPALSASPAVVDFQYSSSQPAPQPVNVTITASDNSSPALTASITPGLNTPSTLFGETLQGHTLTVSVDVATLNTLLSGAGVYTATVTVNAPDFSPLTIPVALSVNTSLSISASPAALSFTSPSGLGSQTVNLTASGGSSVAFTVATSTLTGGSWLGVTASTTYTPATLTVAVYPAGVGAGTYSGSITVTPATGGSLSIPVTFQNAANPLSATPTSLSFSYTLGGTAALPQTLNISSILPGDTFTAQAASTGNWLLVNGVTSNVSGLLPVALNVTVNAGALSADTYQGTITVTDGGGSTLAIAVSLVVSGLSAVANPTSLSFVAQAGGPAPATQPVLVNGSFISQFTTTVTGAWLSVSPPSGPAPGTFTVAANPAGLAAGSYSGSITVGVGTHTQVIQATLTVTAGPVLTTTPGAFSLAYASGDTPPAPLPLNVDLSSGGAQTFTVASGMPAWLQVGPAATSHATPATLTVTLTPQTLPTGTYVADIVLVPSVAGGVPVTVPVLLQVSGATAVVPNPTSLAFTGVSGTGPQDQTVQVSALTSIAYTASAATTGGGNWLSVSPSSGTASTTATQLTVTADATRLTQGTYYGAVTLTTVNGVVTQIQVSFTVSKAIVPTSVSPSSLSFTFIQGGTQPAAQNVQVSGSQAFAVTATTSTGATWLSVSPESGSGNGTLSVSVNPTGLAPTTYQGTVTVTPATGAAQTVSVTLTVSPGPSLSASPYTLAFAYTSGNPNPASQTVSVASAGPAVTFTATASSTGWLSVSPTTATTPATLTVSADPTGMGGGTYNGSIALSGNSGALQFTINVTLTVVAPLPAVDRVVNAASYLGGGISPGEIVVVFGNSLGPITGVSAQVDQSGHIGTKLGNVQVTFNGYAGPVLYASSGQVNAIVPYEMAGATSASVEVIFGNARSNVITLPVVSSAPGIFSADASGTGGGAILDVNYQLVTASNPVSVGSAIQIFATGQGQTSPAGVDGLIEPLSLPLPQPLLAASALIGGLPAQIIYVGAAPGLVAGALQVNAVIPEGVTPGAAPVYISFGGNSGSQNGITVFVQ